MAKTFHLNVVDTHQEIFSGEVEQVIIPGIMGELCIKPGHAQLITTIKPGELRYISSEINNREKTMTSLFVAGGILEVQPKVTTVLADTLIRSKDIDAQAAQESMLRAQEKLMDKKLGNVDVKLLHAEIAMMKALIQMSRTRIKHRGL